MAMFKVKVEFECARTNGTTCFQTMETMVDNEAYRLASGLSSRKELSGWAMNMCPGYKSVSVRSMRKI